MVKKKQLKDIIPSTRKCIVFAFILLISALTFFISKNQTTYANEEINVIAYFQANDNMHLLIYDGDNFTGENDVTLRCTIQAGEDSCQTWLPKLYEQVDGSHKYGNRLVWKADSYDYKKTIQTEIVPQFNEVDKITFTRADVTNNHSASFSFVAYHYYEYTATFVTGRNVSEIQEKENSSMTSDGYWTTCKTNMITFAYDNDGNTPGCRPSIPYQVKTSGGIVSGNDESIGYRSGNEDLGRGEILGIFKDTFIEVEQRFYKNLRFYANGNQIQYNGITSWNGSKVYSCYTYSSQGTCTIPNYRPPVISQVPEGYTLKGYSSSAYKMLTREDADYNSLTPLINENIGQEIEQPLTLGNGQDELIFYAISTKTVTATFNPNGNTNTQTTTKSCERSAGYPCEVTVPTINTQPNTPTVIGWSPTQNTETIKSKNPNFRQPSNVSMEYWVHNDTYKVRDNITLYAHTMSEKKTYTGYFARATEGDSNLTASCTIDVTYNNAAQAESCQAYAPYYNYPSGWKNAKWTDGTNTYEYPSSIPLKQETTHFSWAGDPISYKVKFYANGGTGTMSDLTVEYGKTVKLPRNAFTYDEAHYFMGWNTQANGSGTSYANEQNISNLTSTDNGEIILYAQWGRLYKVTYNCTENGGTCDSDTPDYVDAGANADMSRVASKNGWVFVGWNTNKDATTSLAYLIVTKDQTLYAIYKKTPTLTFLPNGAASLNGTTTYSCNMFNKDTSCSVSFTAPGITPRSGFEESTGFSETQNSTIPTIMSGTEYTKTINKDTFYYAVHYAYAKVRFEANGNTIKSFNTPVTTYTDQTCRIDGVEDECEIDIPDFTPAAKSPIGYTEHSDFRSDDHIYTAGSKIALGPGKNRTLYAHSSNASKKYSAMFEFANGTSTDVTCNINATYNTADQATSCTITAPNITQKVGYKNPRWRNLTVTVSPNSSITLFGDGGTYYEIQTPITYTVKFEPGEGGEGTMESLTYEYDKSYTLPENQFTNNDKDSYFSQWCTVTVTAICFRDKATVENLSSTDGAIVTLTADWKKFDSVIITIPKSTDPEDGTEPLKCIYFDENYCTAELPDVSRYKKTGKVLSGFELSDPDSVNKLTYNPVDHTLRLMMPYNEAKTKSLSLSLKYITPEEAAEREAAAVSKDKSTTSPNTGDDGPILYIMTFATLGAIIAFSTRLVLKRR